MQLFGRLRFTLAKTMMFVLTAGAASALYVKIFHHVAAVGATGWRFDAATLCLLAIVLTAFALGSLKSHSAVQMMLQATLACLGFLTLIWIAEAHYERAIRYWFQGTFAVTVALPLLSRMIIKATLPRGPRRSWWKKTCEAVVFSFLNLVLVSAGAVAQAAVIGYGSEFFAKP
jgi:hypothetical protein